jgi:hypothetical protein
MTNQQIEILKAAVLAADLYLNSYDTSAPSRIKAETRLALEEAVAAIKTAEGVKDDDDWEGPLTPEYSEDDMESYDEMVRDDLAGRS